MIGRFNKINSKLHVYHNWGFSRLVRTDGHSKQRFIARA